MMVGFHEASSFGAEQKGDELRGFFGMLRAGRDGDSVADALSAKLRLDRGEALKIQIDLNLLVKFLLRLARPN